MPESNHRGWYKTGNLPHYDAAELYQFITFRLDDSVSAAMLEALETELKGLQKPKEQVEMARRKRIEQWLDAGYGSCILRRRENAELLIDAWRHFDGERYDLLAGGVMPNHVHLLVRVYQGAPLGEMVKSWKSYTSPRFVVDESVDGRPHWQRGYWDRFIRDEGHYRDTVRYISTNPIKAGLVERVEDWPYFVGCIDANP